MKTSQFKKQYHNYTRANPSRKPVPPLEKHSTHQVEIREVKSSKHYGKYWCLDCDMWISWISQKEWDQAQALGMVVEDKNTITRPKTWAQQRADNGTNTL